MPNKTGDFDVLKLTNAGRDMLTQGRAGHVLTFTKVVIGDGTATGAAVDNLIAIKSPKLTLPIAKNETVHAGQMRLQFRVSNSLVDTSFYFREIGLMAKVDNGEEKLYAYTTCGDKAKLVYDKTYPIQEKIINIDTVTDNAVNVKVILDLSIMYATKKDIVDMIKPHKELAELDHPDESVTTRKLKDKSVTLPKLADDVNELLQKTYVKKTGDTMTGDLTLENNKRLLFNNGDNITHASMYVNSNNTLNIGVNDLKDKAVNRISLHSIEKPQWYNTKNGTKVLATEEYVNTETAKYLPLAGGTMEGNITFKHNESSIKFDGGTDKIHSIDVGGTNGENLNIGYSQQTAQANLCCYNRPGWYGKDKTNTFKPFLFDDDMIITSGTVNDGQVLPIPEGFEENECHFLLSPNTTMPGAGDNSKTATNMYDVSLFRFSVECWRDGNKAHIGTRIYRHSPLTDGPRDTKWFPGIANYVCIARKTL